MIFMIDFLMLNKNAKLRESFKKKYRSVFLLSFKKKIKTRKIIGDEYPFCVNRFLDIKNPELTYKVRDDTCLMLPKSRYKIPYCTVLTHYYITQTEATGDHSLLTLFDPMAQIVKSYTVSESRLSNIN